MLWRFKGKEDERQAQKTPIGKCGSETGQRRHIIWGVLVTKRCHHGKLGLNHVVSSGNKYRAHCAILPENWGTGDLGTPTPVKCWLRATLEVVTLLVCHAPSKEGCLMTDQRKSKEDGSQGTLITTGTSLSASGDAAPLASGVLIMRSKYQCIRH